MSCANIKLPKETPSCGTYGGGVKTVYLIKQSDCVIKDGEIRIKRKYGKFKREIIIQQL